MKELNKFCFFCGDIHYNGIMINRENICEKCEDKIVNTNIFDKNYDYYKNKMRLILFK